MKYMLIMRSTDEAFEAFADLDFAEVMDTVGAFNDELVRSGVLVAAEGLDSDPASGVVVDFTGESPAVTDGPYGETKELFGGFYVLDVPSIDDAVAWARRMPLTDGTKVEIRRVTTIDEFPQDNQWVQKERAWREATGQI